MAVATKRVNKWLYGWKLFVNYGDGWEYETFETTYKGYKENRKQYRENCNYPQRWSRGRETNPDYVPTLKGSGNVKDTAGVPSNALLHLAPARI